MGDKYIVGKKTSFVSNGRIYQPKDEIDSSVFGSEDLQGLIDAGKLLTKEKAKEVFGEVKQDATTPDENNGKDANAPDANSSEENATVTDANNANGDKQDATTLDENNGKGEQADLITAENDDGKLIGKKKNK